MINLEELEKRIDALLESETVESLKEWLSNNKSSHVDCYVDVGGLGGTYQNLVITDKIDEVTVQTPKTEVSEDSEYTYTNPTGYGIAA